MSVHGADTCKDRSLYKLELLKTKVAGLREGEGES